MKTRIVRIGNSRGVRLPKALIEEAGLGEAVELQLEAGGIVIRPAAVPRAGWAAAAASLAGVEGGGLLDAPTATRFEEKEWAW